ncbi:NlpC/P60 family protein [Saccharomonospora piscinae]|uniref:C40 family peptidase n=1 Tax=Saccharomonospora piscinae TaxID=687388 RepID=UPI0011075935|nr:C40 family peptidase [Saccharomonospora piscinae]TLW89735.1 NlpC/P60 family protein [Saccharomonospora piscinae]
MRAGLLIGFVAAATMTVLVAAGAVLVIDSQRQHAHATPVSCNAALGPTQPGQQGRGATDAGNLAGEQLDTVSRIISIGQERDLSPRAWQIAIQAGMTESGLRSLDYGDRDSLGIFQMRPSMGWGTPAQVTDPTYAINKFYDVLEAIPGWESLRPGDAAQAVERSAFPDRYHEWEPMAVYLVETMGEVPDATGCGPGMGSALPPNEQAGQAIDFALEERGKPYVWGAVGPDSYDCSGLMLRAYESAGITLPRVSRDQYQAGAMLPVEQAQPGDLVFWAYDSADPATIHHVALYIGDGTIVEAQQSGVPVHTRAISWDEAGLVPQAVRPGV